MAELKKIKRPKSTLGTTTRVRLQCGNLYVVITRHEGKMFEIFAVMGNTGGCAASGMAALTTSITMGIRHGVPPEVYIEKLKGIHCPEVSWDEGVRYDSCADAIGQVMEEELKKIKSGVYAKQDGITDKL